KQLQEEIDQLRIGFLAVFLSEDNRISAAAKPVVFRRGQRQGEVLTEQQRLSVEPRWPAVPALDRRRVEEILAQGLQRRRQSNGADPAFQRTYDAEDEFDGRFDPRPISPGREE